MFQGVRGEGGGEVFSLKLSRFHVLSFQKKKKNIKTKQKCCFLFVVVLTRLFSAGCGSLS